MTRSALLAIVAESAVVPKDDVILHALSTMCGAAAIEATSEELAVAIFRARAAAWFRRGRAG